MFILNIKNHPIAAPVPFGDPLTVGMDSRRINRMIYVP
jgi:hypothetical protein